MQTDLITKVYFNEHLTHSCVGMPQGLQALLSSLICANHLPYLYGTRFVLVNRLLYPPYEVRTGDTMV